MINTELLAEICKVAGAPGHEQKVREIVLREISELVDEVRIDNMGNVVAIKKGKASKKGKKQGRINGFQEWIPMASWGTKGRLLGGNTRFDQKNTPKMDF